MLKKVQLDWIKKLNKLDYPTPFKVTDLNFVRENVEIFKKLLPRVEIFYAIKSCDDSEVINSIDRKVTGYDIASYGEFKKLHELGIASDRMLYSNPVKVPSHIEQTYKEGVRHYAFDSLDEIKKLVTYAPDCIAYLRVKVSDYGSKFPLSSKFGIEPIHATAYIEMARNMGLNVRGLAFHVGSQSENPHTWQVAFETCGSIISKIKETGVDIDFLNIGGGFPVTYTERIAHIKQLADMINASIEKYIPKDIRIVAEPGRFISANSSVIVSSVIGREHRGSGEWLFLDMGVFQGLMEPLEMEGWKYPIFTDFGKSAIGISQPFTLTGPTCDAYDTLGFDYLLPSSLKVGDRLYIGASGAYTGVYASRFNGFDPPKTHFINKRESILKKINYDFSRITK
jgi:ornithine decarboxylase